MTKVSVVIPTYNCEPYIIQCLNSLLSQDLKEMEFIFVDDGSSDNTVNILKSFSEKDSRIIVLQQNHSYAGAARNYGLSCAKGEYIHFLDGDDFVEPNVYSGWYEFAKKHQADACKCYYNRYNVSTKTTEVRGSMPSGKTHFCGNLHDEPEYFISNPVVPWDKLYRREFLIENNLSFDNLICCNDRSFYFMMLLHAERIAIYPKVALTYRWGNPGSLIGTTRLKNFDCCFKSFERYWSLYKNESDFIKKWLVHVTVVDFFTFYKKAPEEYQVSLRKQIGEYLETMDFSAFGDSIKDFSWYLDYLAFTRQDRNTLERAITHKANREKDAYAKTVANQMAQEIYSSNTYKLGRIVSYPYRKIRGAIRYKKTHSLGETLAHTVFVLNNLFNAIFGKLRTKYNETKKTKKLHPGLNRTKRDPKVIVSLTSFPARTPYVHQTIDSLLRQTFRPDAIILWLAEEQFPQKEKDLPAELLKLKKYGLEIKWCEDLRSYKKLIPTLKEYPDDIVVTTDDDVLYASDWLESLYNSYVESVKERKMRIHCHRVTKFDKDAQGEWKITTASKSVYNRPTYLHKLVGVGGVLYPPHSLHPDVLNIELFKKLAPTNDDIWFWAMAVLNGVRIKVCSPCYPVPKLIEGSQVESLTSINDNGPNLFWKDFNRIAEHYPEFSEKLHWEWEVIHPKRRTPDYYAAISPTQYPKELENYYSLITRKDIDIYNPVNFNEKIQWLKIFGVTPEKTRLADKVLVRDWIAEKIGEKYLIPIIGVYSNADDIDFESLPNSFVLKSNHGSGWNLIVHDKSTIDWPSIKEEANNWLTQNYAYRGMEMHYRNIKPLLLIEEKLVNQTGDSDIPDYKFVCFNGKVEYIWVDTGRFTDHCRDVFDKNWNLMPFRLEYANATPTPKKPKKLEEMIKLAETLCQGYPFVRVDFYYVNETIYFGEMTFTSDNGRTQFIPPEMNNVWGDKIILPPTPDINELYDNLDK